MPELREQLRAYARVLDESAAVAAGGGGAPRPRRAIPSWLAVAAAALLVVASVGGVLLVRRAAVPDVATTVPATTTTVIAESIDFALVSPDPVFVGGEEGDAWGYPHAGPGGVTVVDGKLYAMRTGGGEAGSAVGLSTSEDGRVWVATSPDPILEPADIPWPAATVSAGSLLRDGDGRWLLFFWTRIDTGVPGAHHMEYRIGVATAAAPEGPWAVHPAPLIEPGPDGSWYPYLVAYPAVVETEDGFVMYFSGGSKEGAPVIGSARSADGIDWSVDDEPRFVALAAWEDGGVTRPDVIVGDDGWVMTYAGRTGGTRGFAFSDDGVHWRRFPANPVLRPTDVPRAQIFATALVRFDDRYLWLVQNGGEYTSSDTHVLVHEGPLP